MDAALVARKPHCSSNAAIQPQHQLTASRSWMSVAHLEAEQQSTIYTKHSCRRSIGANFKVGRGLLYLTPGNSSIAGAGGKLQVSESLSRWRPRSKVTGNRALRKRRCSYRRFNR